MKRSVLILSTAFLFNFLRAQIVLYSPVIYDRYSTRFEIAGKTENYYWLFSETQPHSKHIDQTSQSFNIFNSKLDEIASIKDQVLPENVLKEYFVPQKNYFDKLLLLQDGNEINIHVQRFLEDGSASSEKAIAHFNFVVSGNNFLLVRSEDKNKILLLCFQNIPEVFAPFMHAILFDVNWHELSSYIYQKPFITQAMIQDDFIGYPIESFNNAPIQVADNGQWFIASSSRTNNNFLFLHFCNDDSSVTYKEIILPEYSQLDDVALSIDNENLGVFAGVLSNFHYQALKNAHVVHYSMQEKKFDFDSSYKFSTLPGNKIKNENIVHESFVAVPGKGFMLLKEYGKEFISTIENDNWDPEIFFAGNSSGFADQPIANTNVNGYTRFNALSATGKSYKRGDMSIFFFPAQKNEICWSGFINKQQTTEQNSPNLSYLLFPEKNKLALLYNSFLKNEEQFGSSTFLNDNGYEQNDGGIAFQKYNTMLNFQNARQIDTNEVAVPYLDKERKGFAIIKF